MRESFRLGIMLRQSTLRLPDVRGIMYGKEPQRLHSAREETPRHPHAGNRLP
jgi:hypothetical protein